MEKILVVVAHPDDEVLGCGGTIVKMANMGLEIRLLVIADGVSSRSGLDGTKNNLEKRKKACRLAAEALGICEVKFIDLPDNSLDQVPLLRVINEIEGFCNIYKPQMVITHHGGDLNIDHRIVFQACLTAFRPMPNGSVKKLISFEIPSSTEWQSPVNTNYFMPNWFVDISETIEQKMLAFNFYQEEKRAFPHPRSEESLRALAAYRGSIIGCHAAEAFVLIRNIE